MTTTEVRINRTRAEQAARRRAACRASAANHAAYAVPEAWQAARDALVAALEAAVDPTARRAARNALTVHNLFKPEGTDR